MAKYYLWRRKLEPNRFFIFRIKYGVSEVVYSRGEFSYYIRGRKMNQLETKSEMADIRNKEISENEAFAHLI